MIHSPMGNLPSKGDSSPNGGRGVNEPRAWRGGSPYHRRSFQKKTGPERRPDAGASLEMRVPPASSVRPSGESSKEAGDQIPVPGPPYVASARVQESVFQSSRPLSPLTSAHAPSGLKPTCAPFSSSP